MGKNKELLLVHSSMNRVSLTNSVNVMLTPQFYTLKREALPVKYAYQAKKVAPSLFEGLLEDKDNYEYVVIKEEDGWAFIAYDIESISTFLATKGIEKDKVAKLFFAQESFKHFSNPLGLGEHEALVSLDDTVVVVPRMALGNEEHISSHFDEGFTPSGGGISIKGGSSSTVFTRPQALSFAVIFILFAGMFTVEGLRYGGDGTGNTEELKSLQEENPTLSSTYTRQGIIDKYKMIDSKERKKRDVMKSFSSMIFKGVTLVSVNVDDKRFKADFSCTSADVTKRLRALVKKAKLKMSKGKQNNRLNIEGAL